MPLVEHELLTLLEHLSSPSVFSGVRVNRSLVLCVCIIDRCLFFCSFSFGHCFVCSSSIYGFWLSLWYLQTLLMLKRLTSSYPGFVSFFFFFYLKHIHFKCLNCEQKIDKQTFVQNVCRYVFIAEIWNFGQKER